jgi:carbamoyl-phosphate synthase small subunit
MAKAHRGAWLPVTELKTGNIIYTWQCHGQSPEEPLPESLSVTHRNAADGTPEGFVIEGKPVSAIHFLPCSDLRVGGTGDIFSALFDLLRQKGVSMC